MMMKPDRHQLEEEAKTKIEDPEMRSEEEAKMERESNKMKLKGRRDEIRRGAVLEQGQWRAMR